MDSSWFLSWAGLGHWAHLCNFTFGLESVCVYTCTLIWKQSADSSLEVTATKSLLAGCFQNNWLIDLNQKFQQSGLSV